ncbi:hypothetical protein [Bacillus cereus]|uniref:hypothetical protein n=1 Tax=Bacillus cereus TaxID=1396 RepID=UPI000B4ACF60|nr:hypothetical protein [Bacillus cereus]
MTVLYGDYECRKCNKEQKVMHEINDGNDHLVMPGDKAEVTKEFEYKCEMCGQEDSVFVLIKEESFVGFINVDQKDEAVNWNIPSKEEVLKKWAGEKSNVFNSSVDFKEQPFEIGQEVTMGTEEFTIKKVYRMEWVEKDMDKRLEFPRPETYWYEVSTSNGRILWMKVESWDENNVFVSESGIVVSDKNEVIEDISDNPEKVKLVYESEWFGGREIEAYQYINGIRILVTNYKKQIEMDIFEDTFESAMNMIEENMELGVFNE